METVPCTQGVNKTELNLLKKVRILLLLLYTPVKCVSSIYNFFGLYKFHATWCQRFY